MEVFSRASACGASCHSNCVESNSEACPPLVPAACLAASPAANATTHKAQIQRIMSDMDEKVHCEIGCSDYRSG
jgi:hypothetical protein